MGPNLGGAFLGLGQFPEAARTRRTFFPTKPLRSSSRASFNGAWENRHGASVVIYWSWSNEDLKRYWRESFITVTIKKKGAAPVGKRDP